MEVEKNSAPDSGATEIAFFDVETTVPSSRGSGYALLEFGAVLVCPRRLVEVGSYSTLIRPADPSAISAASVRCNGITPDVIANAPSFGDVADTVFAILHGRVWAGHNIIRFDCLRIREAFAEIGRPPPEPKGMIDTLPLLTQRFGRRAGDMKMASLATYFGLGQQKHRSIDDVRMNLEVVKYCATVLFLEASLPDILSVNSLVYENRDSSELVAHIDGMKLDCAQTDALIEGCSGSSRFLEPHEVSSKHISAPIIPFYQSGRRIVIHHKDSPLQLCCMGLRIHFGVSAKFVDTAGRPKLNIVVDIPESLCNILDECDKQAQKTSQESGSTSLWRALIRKDGSLRPTMRLRIPTTTNGDSAIYSTEIYQKEQAGNIQKLVFTKLDVAELDSLFIPGSVLDAFFCPELYDYQQNAGIRLVAKRLIHSKWH
ncbi:protein NEN1-like [Ananas comosus]|uniref:Protein NEN1-like n=1 Tax=Ananas comosus TaxID=4615 RepID=A0A6P5G773_ANACO|nr:protein NEN1-like [Ananas comosus]